MVDAGLFAISALTSPFWAELNLFRCLFNEDKFIGVFFEVPFSVVEPRVPAG